MIKHVKLLYLGLEYILPGMIEGYVTSMIRVGTVRGCSPWMTLFLTNPRTHYYMLALSGPASYLPINTIHAQLYTD